MDSNEIIIEPVLTEKANFQREGEIKTYVFKVSKKANKLMVMQAVGGLFKVQPTDCRIINVRGKRRNNRAISRTTFRRGRGRTSAWKKAMVTLQKGQTIDAFEGV
ncbi:LSU ribosomal protein L23p (L23Ae) [Olavius algarvensis spirochete endosymbiont]|uniref:50S ribosomal protein L23 n=1 Tax=Olavius algarvensis spirochete endosymbiont TaxID=260710 RepID=UPI000F0F325E|nr:50S ribosomal protein L23 [Olavius algarvensis spirochete endosymbiont]VDB01092.1 LSU ribosomal protein L23p (L23Ae) [Olavius algarvensis spirochete endosymbiont]